MGMISGEKHHIINFHNILHMPSLHLLHNHSHHHQRSNSDEDLKDVPKGCLAILVGHEDTEQLQRFVIPLLYFNHPKFMQLLKEAEEEYGFNHKGPITIPCHVEEFLTVQDSIDKEQQAEAAARHYGPHHHQGHQQNGHENHHHFLCFKA